MKELPVSDSSFKKIILNNLLYADKTAYIHKMIKPSTTCCFLSRPRRFGKTLLLSTIEELFRGNRELFKGLWIDSEEANYDFKQHPVVRLSMAYSKMGSPDELEKRIANSLLSIAKKERIQIIEDSYGEILGELLQGLSEKHGTQPVVLVDEYDAPVTSHIENHATAKANSAVLHGFYRSLKANVDHVRFALVTGITRFALTSMDSGPNNFYDLSLDPEYGGACGFTISEFDRLFGERMDSTLEELLRKGEMPPDSLASDLREKILSWYDGYNWLGPERVLNPYSMLYFFQKRSFETYWPLSGLPNHLSALVRQNPMNFIMPKLEDYNLADIKKVSLGRIEPVPILFHSGYLTIDRMTEATSKVKNEKIKVLFFKPPNNEVKTWYDDFCFETLFDTKYDHLLELGQKFLKYLEKRDSEKIGGLFSDLLSNIAYWQHPAGESAGGKVGQETGPKATPDGESLYHGLIQISLSAMGLTAMGEIPGAIGRGDIAIFLPNRKVLTIELKYCRAELGDAPEKIKKALAKALKEAFKTMAEKDHGGPHRISASEIIGLGLAVYGRKTVLAGFIGDKALKRPL